MTGEGWYSLFATAFKRSRNPMMLANAARIQVDVNPAFAQLLQRRRSALIGQHMYDFVRNGPLLSEDEWKELMLRDEVVGEACMLLPKDNFVVVQWAAHPEVVTGRRLVLFVALTTYRSGRHFRRYIEEHQEDGMLSDREMEIVRLVALGESGPEIADQLHITHNTVRTHVRNAMVKTGARSRAHLVAKALGQGLVLD
ncbi:MAG TPA: LuxR C-terminal-related transcriptional regulator [Thermoleophilaceae bacterium]|jgi:DNA-binding CsgD family transcriptional regulator